MPKVKKKTPFHIQELGKNEIVLALEILAMLNDVNPSKDRRDLLASKIKEFQKNYSHPIDVTLIEVWRWVFYAPTHSIHFPFVIYDAYAERIKRIDKEPTKVALFEGTSFVGKKHIGDEWVFKEHTYEVDESYSDNEIKLLILEDFDRERRYFEKLKVKFDDNETPSKAVRNRSRIPESVRIEVWRRDGGKCARCGSREKLEYDHIVPISKGGSNTARNIELLCEKHNRSKSNNVV